MQVPSDRQRQDHRPDEQHDVDAFIIGAGRDAVGRHLQVDGIQEIAGGVGRAKGADDRPRDRCGPGFIAVGEGGGKVGGGDRGICHGGQARLPFGAEGGGCGCWVGGEILDQRDRDEVPRGLPRLGCLVLGLGDAGEVGVDFGGAGQGGRARVSERAKGGSGVSSSARPRRPAR